jgi:hypothetical protein
MRPIVIMLMPLLIASCSTLKVNQQSSKSSGFWYALPKNIIVVEVPVKRTAYKRLKCFDTVDKAFPYLKLSETYDKGSSITYSLSKVALSTKAVPDIQKVYELEPSKQFFRNFKYQFVYSDLGVLSSAELQNENKTFDAIIESIGAVTSVASSFAPKGLNTNSADICDKVIELLSTIQTSRLDLISKENRGTKEVLEKQLDQLDLAEAGVIDGFVVEKATKEVVLRFNFEPGTGNMTQDLFRFSSSGGVSGLSTVARGYSSFSVSDNVLAEILDASPTGKEEVVSVSIGAVDLTTQLAGSALLQQGGKSLSGFVFNVPVQCNVVVKKGTTSIARTDLMIAQLGSVSRITHKIGKLSVELDPTTGALKKISGENTAVADAAIKKAGTAASGSVDAVKKITEKDTELELLIKERQILEEKKKIKDLKASGN